MALRELSRDAALTLRRTSAIPFQTTGFQSRYQSSAAVAEANLNSTTPAFYDIQELEDASASVPSAAAHNDFDPAKQARERDEQLPSSRYKFRPPRYYRGPLHPHQPPKSTDIASRQFSPGPFSLPRLAQTYENTIAPDLMALSYQHYPPGYEAPKKGERLRSWDDSSLYHKNRPLRGPRGGDTLRLLRKPITFRNVPRLTGVTVHSFVQGASQDNARLQVASMAIQAITGVRCNMHQARKNVVDWGLRSGRNVAVTSEMIGEDMYNFIAKTVDVVMPRIKDWKGVSGTSGDGSGNISFGMIPDEVAYYPEIEVNYDSYPPKMIPGCNITIKTSATNDRDARLLLMALGIPFHGKQVN